MTEKRQVVEGEMFGAPVPGRWPGGRDRTDTPRGDEPEPDERPGIVARLRALVGGGRSRNGRRPK